MGYLRVLKKRFADLRLRNKLILSYSTIFFLAISLTNVTIYLLVQQTIESTIENELNNSTKTILNMVKTSANTSIKAYLHGVAAKNRDIAEHFYNQFQAGLMTEADAKAAAGRVMLSQTVGETGYIYCVDTGGKIAVHPKAELLNQDLNRFEFIREQTKRKQGYLEYDWKNPGESEARPKALYMTFFEPWNWIISASSYRREFTQLVNVDDFRESILALKFGETGYSYVVDIEGNMIIHHRLHGNYYNVKDINGRQFVREICEKKSGKTVYTWESKDGTEILDKVVIFNHIPEFDWIVASSGYLQEFYAPLKTVRFIFTFSFTVVLALVLTISFRLSAGITNPLQELIDRFSQGAKGDISVRMKQSTRDEMGKLAGYFNMFMERLEISSNSLKGEIAERRKSEEKYRELVQNANSIILRIDITGHVTFLNEYAQGFFGYTDDRLLGKSIIGTIVPDDGSRETGMLSMVRDKGAYPDRYIGFEDENIKKNGDNVSISWTNRAVQDKSGMIREYLCVGNDITESRRVEREMARMRHYLKSLVDSMPSILVGVNTRGRVTQWNREAEIVSCIPRDRAVGRKLTLVAPGLSHAMDSVTLATRDGSVQIKERVIHPFKGNRFYSDVLVYPLTERGGEGAVIRVDDVSERVKLENLIIQTEKMKSVGGLAAGMAHEINNPLGCIVQSTQNILRRVSPDLKGNRDAADACGTDLEKVVQYLEDREIIRFLEDIRISVDRTSKIVVNMLNFSRQGVPNKKPVSLTDLMEKTIALASHDYDLKKRYGFKKIRIIRDYPSDLPMVMCKASEIEQVVLNLLRNAAQALAEAEAVEPAITLGLRHEDNSVLIQVEDNGPGMDEETCNRVFEPFFTTKEVGGGTGLGLSVSYYIVTNNHMGTIEVESAPGNGARFVVQLPVDGEPTG